MRSDQAKRYQALKFMLTVELKETLRKGDDSLPNLMLVYTSIICYTCCMFERCLYFNLNALTRKVNRIWESEFRQTGLPASHAYVLRLVLSEPGISQKQLARELHLAPSTVTRFVDALIKRRLVRRNTSHTDRRSATVYPTAEGKRLQKKLERIGEGLFQAMKTKLGDKHFQELVRALREARSTLEKS